MRAVVLPAVGRSLEVRDDHPEAGTGRDGGEIVDVTACGVCHSDLHVVDGEFPSPLPLVRGHEVTGVHRDLGPVMVYAPWGCGACRQCRDGEEMICADATEAGLFVDGGYSDRMWVAHRRYLAPLDGLDPFTALVNEAPGRLVLSAAPEHRDALGAFLGDHGRRIGEVTAGDDIVFHLLDPAQGAGSNLEPIRIPLADAVSASTHGPSGPTRGATA